jgi:hypothetical protein
MFGLLRISYLIRCMQTVKTKFVNYKAGGPEAMFLDERELKPEEGEVLIKIKALGINRAETLHRKGAYKINRPVESFLGLEASGEVYDPKTKYCCCYTGKNSMMESLC